MLVANRDVRILASDGEMIRHLCLDPNRIYQPLGLQIVHDVLRHLSTMSQDITLVSEGLVEQNPIRGSSHGIRGNKRR
jgi:hypothetical protein